jgi:RHS repeat-associated protein
VSYFRSRTARNPGLRTTSQGWVSIYPLSQNAGRVNGYDVSNRIVSVPGGTQYAYAPGNKRIWRGTTAIVNGSYQLTLDELTFWSVSGQKLATYTVSGNPAVSYSSPSLTVTLATSNYYFGGKLIKNANGYIGSDRLGSVGKYYPWGQEKPSATTNGFEKFTGYFRDSETGLDYADQRYHQPGAGRFLTPDPYQPSAGPSNPGSWNRYAYAGGDPIKYKDPGGRELCDPDSDSCGGDWTCGANWMTDASLSGPCADGGGGGDGGGGFCEGGNQFFNSNTGSCEDDTSAGEESAPPPDCSLELEYWTAAKTGRSHASLVVTDSSGYTFTMQGQPQYYPFPHRGRHGVPTWGNLEVSNTPGNIGDQQWGNTLTSSIDPSLCAQISDIETAEDFYSKNMVTYKPWGPNSNSLVAWLLQSGYVSSYFTAPPKTTGWTTSLYYP